MQRAQRLLAVVAIHTGFLIVLYGMETFGIPYSWNWGPSFPTQQRFSAGAQGLLFAQSSLLCAWACVEFNLLRRFAVVLLGVPLLSGIQGIVFERRLIGYPEIVENHDIAINWIVANCKLGIVLFTAYTVWELVFHKQQRHRLHRFSVADVLVLMTAIGLVIAGFRRLEITGWQFDLRSSLFTRYGWIGPIEFAALALFSFSLWRKPIYREWLPARIVLVALLVNCAHHAFEIMNVWIFDGRSLPGSDNARLFTALTTYGLSIYTSLRVMNESPFPTAAPSPNHMESVR